MNTIKCKVCNNWNIKMLGEYWNINNLCYCKKCNTYFIEKTFTDKELEKYYQWFTFNGDKWNSKIIIFLKNIILKWVYYKKAKKVKKTILKYTSKKSILDFWGGVWWFSYWFKKNWYDVSMIEYDQESINQAKKKWIKSYILWKGIWQFPIVFSFHIIEHYENLHGFFENITKYIEPNGIFILSLPNKDCKEFYRTEYVEWYLEEAHFKIEKQEFLDNTWFCIDPPRHLYAISKETIFYLSKEHWFEILDYFSESSSNESFSANFMYSMFNIRSLSDIIKFIRYFILWEINMKKNKYWWNSLVFILKKISWK